MSDDNNRYNNNNNNATTTCYTIRDASHGGTWYDNDPKRLSSELDNYFTLVESTKPNKSTKAIISPHAGYRYCGKVAACAYNAISNNVNRVFILGPSHHRYLDNCALPNPNIKEYDTPFGTLPLDEEVLGELRALSKTPDSEFGTVFSKEEDEDEHSIEMQLPLIYHQLKHRQSVKHDVTIVPIIVGVLSANVERVIGRLLAKYFKEEGTLFVISSDFCHWGLRFRYTQLQTDKDTFPDDMVFNGDTEPINAGIEAMDREGMALISNQDFDGFKRYLQTTGNTICGRHPISVLLETLRNVNEQYDITFKGYDQSTILPSKPSRNDSCVAYAAGVVEKEDNDNNNKYL